MFTPRDLTLLQLPDTPSILLHIVGFPGPVYLTTSVPALSVAAAEIEWHEDPTFTATSLDPNADVILFSCSDQLVTRIIACDAFDEAIKGRLDVPNKTLYILLVQID